MGIAVCGIVRSLLSDQFDGKLSHDTTIDKLGEL